MFSNVRRISRQLLAYGSADVLVLAINFVLLPIYTRALSPREYGALALLLVCEAVLKIVNRWGLDAGFLRFHYECATEEERRTLAGTICMFLALANGALALVLIAASAPIGLRLLHSAEFTTAFRLLVLNSFLSTFLFLPLNLLRIQERARLFATLSFLRSFGTVLIRLFLVIVLRWSLTGIFLADLMVTALLLATLAGTLRNMIVWRFSPTMLRSLLRYGFPQVPNGLLTQAIGMGDRFVLSLFMPLAAVGIYLIGSTVASVVKYFPVAFETVWTPFAYDSLQRRDAPALFARMGTYAFVVLAFLTVALMGLAAPLMAVALPPNYLAIAPLVPLLTVAMAVQALRGLPGTSLNISKQTHVYPVVTAVGAAVSLAANFLLIPRFGLNGAAMALLASQALTTGLTVYFAQRAYAIPYELPRLLKVLGIGAATYGVMIMATSPSAWQTLATRTGLLVIFPAGLLALRFLEPHEWKDVRKLVETLRRPAVPV
jgi:O-antigen/teichoic acid export membrane protein